MTGQLVRVHAAPESGASLVLCSEGDPAAPDGLTSTMLGSVTSLEAVAGAGTAALSGTRITLTLAASGAVVFLV